MYKTGDLIKNIEKLKIELKQIKYPQKIEADSISEGNPLVFLPILHFTLLSYSKYIAQLLLDNKYELFSKSDKEFINKIFKAMIELFNYKPSINPRQFFMNGYAEGKVIFCLEVIRLVKLEHNSQVKKAYSVNVKNINVVKRNKSNDSFRSNKSTDRAKDDFVNYNNYNTNSNHNKIRIINHQNESETFEEPEIKSPKFRDDEKVDYINNNNNKNNHKTNYKFNENFVKNFNTEKTNKNTNESFRIDNEQNESETENFVITTNQFQNEPKKPIFIPKLNRNKQQVEKYDSLGDPRINESGAKSHSNDFSAIIGMINGLAGSIKEMTSKIDNFKITIEERVNRMEAEISLIKNKVNILESAKKKTGVNNSEANLNLSENNEHIFSFADDQPINKETQHEENKAIPYSNMLNVQNIQQQFSTSNNSHNKFKERALNSGSKYSKMNNEIKETDSIIERAARQFKVAQNLLLD